MQKQLQKLCLLTAMIIVSWAAQAQTLGEYSFSTGTDASRWVDMSTATQILTPSGNDGLASSVQNIGFSFPFGEDGYTQFSVNTDGNLRLGSVVTGTSNYSTPFSATNAVVNNPKINAFGCDGYGESGSHYVKKLLVNDTLLVVEFCMGTYTSSTRSQLYKWQVHMYASGDIEIVYGAAPTTNPAVARQPGLCVNASDGWTISGSHTATHFTAGTSSTTVTSGTWPAQGRYYRFDRPVITCPRPTSLTSSNVTPTSFDIQWTDTTDATSWLMSFAQGNNAATVTEVYTTSYSFTALTPNTQYTVAVAGLCGNGDTSHWRTLDLRTACSYITTLPYFNDFENEPYYLSGTTSYAEAFPSCWTRINDATSTYNYYPYINTSSTYLIHGSKSMYWYHSTTTTYADNEYAVLPPIDPDVFEVSNLTLSFFAKTTATASPWPLFIVGVMTNPTDATTFVPVDTITLTTTAMLYAVNFTNYTGTGNYIAIRCPRTTSARYCSLDDVFLTDEWCDIPINVTASATTTDVTISWNTNGGSSFTLVFAGDTIAGISDSSYTFTGLNPNTSYAYSVATECTSSLSSFISGSIRTECGAMTTLPYSYGFEDMATGSSSARPVINCWHHLNNATTYFGYPYVSSTTPHSGTRNLYWYASTTTGTYGDYEAVVLPAVDTDIYAINTLQLKFWARPSSTSYSPVFQVGVMTDPDDNNTFQLVNTINVPSGSTTWDEYITGFGNFTGHGQYVAVRVLRPSSSWYAYTDDFTLETAPICPSITDISVDEVGTTGALISWTPQQGVPGEPVGYEIMATPTDTSSSALSFTTTDQTRILLTGLSIGTEYSVVVRADCGSDGYGSWSAPVVFSTGTLPCIQSDPSSSSVMTFNSGTGSTTTYYLPVGNYYNYSYTQELILASEMNGATTINGIEFQYGYSSASTVKTNCTIYMANVSVNDLSSGFVPYNSSFTRVYTGNLNCTSGWNTFNFSTPFQYDGTSNLLIMVHDNSGDYDGSSYIFNAHSTGSSLGRYVQNDSNPYSVGSPDAGTAVSYRANMKLHTTGCLQYGTCAPPLVIVDSTNESEIALSWAAGADETSWDVEYRQGTSGSWIFASTEYSNSYTITSLNASSTYQIRITAHCTDTDMATIITVKTPCAGVSLPYTQTFETAATGTSSSATFVDCMYRLNNGTTYYGYPYVGGSTYNHTVGGAKGLYWYNTTTTGTYGDYQIVVMPRVNASTAPINTLQLTFWSRPSSTSYSPVFTVGVMTDPEDVSTFQSVATVNVLSSTEWQFFEIPLYSYVGNGEYVALRANRPSSSWYAYVDDMTIENAPACPRIGDVVARNITQTDATIGWTPSTADEYEVQYGPAGFTLGTGTIVNFIYTDSVDLTSLNPGTMYDVYVRGICTTDTSNWSFVYQFHTECSFATLPIIENFDAITGSTATSGMANILPPCWDYYNDGTRSNYQGSPYVYSNATYAHSGSNCIRFYTYNSSGDSNQYLILPIFDSNDYSISDLQLSFWLRGNSTSTSYFNNAIVGVMTDPNNEYSFIPYDTILSATTTYTYHEVNLNRYNGPHGRVTILFPKPASSGQYEYGYLDDLMLGPLPTCLSVDNLTSIHVTGDTVILQWTPNGEESEWEVSYDSVRIVVYDTTYIADGLSPNTEYTFTVRAICGVGDTSYPVTYSARTDCGAITSLPYFESFEGLPAGSSTSPVYEVPCYGRLDNAGQNHFGYINTRSSWSAGPHTGDNFLYYYIPLTTGTHADWIITILPPIDGDIYPINSLQLSFWVRMNSSTTSSFIEVGVISNANDETTFVPVDTIPVAGDVHTLKTAYLTDYVGTGNRIAMRFHRASETNYFFIDDITVEEIPDCPAVSNITLAGLTSDSLYVTWSENGTATSWTVEYGPTGFTPGMGTTDIVYTLPYAIGGLTANTAYDVYVTPECFSGVAATRMGTFRTDCGPTPIPFTENFDTWSSTAADPLPNCWDKHTNYSSNYPYASTSYNHSTGGSKSMYMYSTNTTYSYMVLPLFNLPVDSTMISFWLYKSNTSYAHKLQVGVMTNPADVNTFVQVAEVVPTLSSAWEEFEVPLSSYNGTGTRIAIMSPNNEYSYPYLDDLLVTRISNCPRVVAISAANVMLDSAIVTWTDGSNTAWYVEYDSVNFTPGTGHTPIYVTDTSIVLSGLSAGTTYHVYVYPDCDSTAYRYFTFTTLAALPASLPYSCDFEAGGVNGWDLLNGSQGNYWIVGNATNNGGSRSMYITDNGSSNNYSGSASYVFATRTFTMPAGNYICSYDWKLQGESSFDFIRAALVPASTELTPGQYSGFDNASAMPAGSIALDGGYRLNLAGSSWTTQTTEFTLTSAGTYKLVFMWRNDGSVYNQPPAAIDNVALMINSCPMPQNITLSNLNQTSTDVSWHEAGTATEWQYMVGSGSITTVYDTNCTLTGLSANTPYTFRVRAICGTGDTGMWATYNFRTPCGYITLPYTQDFESEPTGSSSTGSAFANCWTRLNNGTSYGGYPYVSSSTTYNHTPSGSKGLYWYNTTTTGTYGDYQAVVLPPIDSVVGADSLQLSFWVKASSASYVPVFQIGVMTDPNNISTFVGVDTITVSWGTNWELVEVPLSAYSGSGQYVAIKADRPSSSWYAYVDDVMLDYIPTCVYPRNVFATDVTTNSITLDWVDITPAYEWQIEYGPQGYTRGSSAGTSRTVSSHPVLIMGLDTLTSYDFYIRPVCTVGDTARWSYANTITTAMCDNSEIFSIGSPSSSGTTYYAPVNNFYNYTLSETIIDSAEIGGPMDIEFIGYYYDYSSPSTVKTNCTIYFQPTTLSTFSSTSSMVALNSSTAVKVYTGPLNCSQGWNFFALDSVYHYDGSSNLLIIVDDNSYDYDGSAYIFRTESCSGNKTIYYYSDSDNPSVTSPSSFSGNTGVASWRPVMQLVSCTGVACRQPVITGISRTYESATITWHGDGTDYEVNIKESVATDWTNPDIHVTGNTYTFTGLQPATNYTFRVRQDCNADSLGYSEWVSDVVLTDSLPCLPPDSLHVTAVTNATATLDWVPFGYETMWDIHVWFSGGLDSVYTVSTHPATVGGFNAGVTYQASVRPLCGSANNIVGDWGDTITFSTAICPDVTGLTTGGVTTNSVTVSWDADPMAVSWIIEYGFHGFDQGTGTTINTTLNTYIINGLMDDMEYDFRVRAVCGDNWMSEGWANASATTLAGGVPCEAPTNVNAIVAGNSATVSWTANTGNISYELEYGTRGFGIGTGTTVSATSSPVTLSNLDYETDYDVYVHALCDQNTLSAWSTVVSFTTEPQGSQDCDPVTDLAASNVTESSALLSWTPGTTGDEWEVVLTTAAGTAVSEASTTEHQFALNGLTPGTAYVAKVRTVCGDGVYSTFASTTFTTTTIGIDGVAEPGCTIYPNPTSSTTTITVSGVSGKVKIAVVDMNGREVTAETLECSGDCAKSFDVDRLAQGAYFVRVTGENVSMVKKLIVR